MKRHPFVAWDFYQARNEATDEAARRYPGELHNGRGDAFRHAYWSALMTQAHGEDLAREFGNAHEDFPGHPPRERAMDLHNNAVGRRIGASHRAPPSLADRIANEVTSGGLRWISP